MTYFAALLLALVSSWCFNVGKGCSESEVFLRFRELIYPNNSHFLYNLIGTRERDRLYCCTNKRICCSEYESNWYFPSGERVLGGYEYDNIRVGVFARSSGYRSLALYRHFSPQQRGRFSCTLPDASGNNCTLFANIVNEIPNIDAQPISQTVTIGQNATFSVEVSNNNFAAYRWQKDKMDLWDNSERYEGTTTTKLTIFNAHEQDEGDYRCIIDNILMSDTAELSVSNCW